MIVLEFILLSLVGGAILGLGMHIWDAWWEKHKK